MRITNLRRGRIARIAAAAAICLMLVYALHKYSKESESVSSSDVHLVQSEIVSAYKYHADVYPKLLNGKCCCMFVVVYSTVIGPCRVSRSCYTGVVGTDCYLFGFLFVKQNHCQM